tara:strand:- start:540 stop:788 length:249 start_codon:yes stop_codon:yes gene_type:complete
MTRSEFEYDIIRREHDDMWQVVAKLSTVRMGLTNREQVKTRDLLDSMEWFTVRVEKNQEMCKKWVDSNWDYLVRMGIPYEVG